MLISQQEIEKLWQQVESLEGGGGYLETLREVDGLIASGSKQWSGNSEMAEVLYMRGYCIYQRSEEYQQAIISFYKSLVYRPDYFWPKLYLGHALFDIAVNEIGHLVSNSEVFGQSQWELLEIRLLEGQSFFSACLDKKEFLERIDQGWRIIKLYELQASTFLYLSEHELFEGAFLKYEQAIGKIDPLDIPVPMELLHAIRNSRRMVEVSELEPRQEQQPDLDYYLEFLQGLEETLCEE